MSSIRYQISNHVILLCRFMVLYLLYCDVQFGIGLGDPVGLVWLWRGYII